MAISLFLYFMLLSPLHALNSEPRAFWELLLGESQTYGEGAGGFGVRLTFPASENFFIGFTLDGILHDSGLSGSTGHLGLSIDYRVFEDSGLFFSGNYGMASFTESDSNVSSAQGNFYDLGLHYQSSEYVDFGVMYRSTDFVKDDLVLQEEEIYFVLSIAFTPEMFQFFYFLTRD